MKFVLILLVVLSCLQAKSQTWAYRTNADKSIQLFTPGEFFNDATNSLDNFQMSIQFAVSLDKKYCVEVRQNLINPLMNHKNVWSVVEKIYPFIDDSTSSFRVKYTTEQGLDIVQLEKYSWDSTRLLKKFIVTSTHVYELTVAYHQKDDPNIIRYLNDWKLSNTSPYQYNVDKTDALKSALKCDTGMAAFATHNALLWAECTPKLQQMLSNELLTHQSYTGPADYTSLSYQIIQKMKDCKVGDEFVDFYNQNSHKIKDIKTNNYILELLSNIGTDKAFRAMNEALKRNKKEIIFNDLPEYDLADGKLKQTSTYLQQEVLDMFSYVPVDKCPLFLVQRLIDSGYLCRQDLWAYHTQIKQEARSKLDTCRKGYVAQMQFVFECLLFFQDKESIDLIKQYQQLNITDINWALLQAELKVGVVPTQSLIDNLVKNRQLLPYLYNLLAKNALQHLFPKEYLTLENYAYGILLSQAMDGWDFNEESPPILTFHSQMSVSHDNVNYKAIVFLLQYGNSDEENKWQQYAVGIYEDGTNIHQQIQTCLVDIEGKYIKESNLKQFVQKMAKDAHIKNRLTNLPK